MRGATRCASKTLLKRSLRAVSEETEIRLQKPRPARIAVTGSLPAPILPERCPSWLRQPGG
jgi:hypothetical protein